MRLTAKLGIILLSMLFVFSICEAGQSADKIRAKAEQGDAEAQTMIQAISK